MKRELKHDIPLHTPKLVISKIYPSPFITIPAGRGQAQQGVFRSNTIILLGKILIMSFNIRLAEVKDVPALTVLFNSDTNIYGEEDTGFGERDVKEYVLDKKKKLFVCEHEDRIVGALMADYHETYSHLETLIVDKSFKKHGAGSALLDHYEKDLESLKIPLIEVMTEIDNSVMQNILVNRGFRKGNTFVFYSKGE